MRFNEGMDRAVIIKNIPLAERLALTTAILYCGVPEG
jgi:hypothetical protein